MLTLQKGRSSEVLNHQSLSSGSSNFVNMCIQNSSKALSNEIFASEIRILKVLTNEKRGGLKMVLFDRPGFKLQATHFSHY